MPHPMIEDRHAAATAVPPVPPEATGGRKVCILGFTESKREAPWGDPSWEFWGINDLHNSVEWQRCHRWYNLHDLASIKQQPVHDNWLRQAQIPVYMWDHYDEYPTSLRFPKDEVIDLIGRRYFTNTIAWLIGHALLEGVTEIAVYGVDMAQGTEYASQRPSCEYLLGIAEGRGVRVHIPGSSDLLKAAGLYGAEPQSDLLYKLKDREKNLLERRAEAEAAHNNSLAAIHMIDGALEDVRYIMGVWLQPEVKRDGSVQLHGPSDHQGAGVGHHQ